MAPIRNHTGLKHFYQEIVLKSDAGRSWLEKSLKIKTVSLHRATYFGDVGAHLANLIIRRLGYKSRAEKPGLLGRASMPWQSEIDREEAERCGRTAVTAVTSGESGKMVALRRVEGNAYRCETFLADIAQFMMTERKLPAHFINAEGNGITEAFRQWCRPLLGGPLPRLMDLR